MPIYEQIPIRLEIDLVSTPPVPPIDANTGQKPVFWRGNSIALQVGLFDAQGNPVDMSNIETVQVILQQAQSSAYPLVVKTLTSGADQIAQLITIQGWRNDTMQNFIAEFTSADTDQSLAGGSFLDYWLIVQGTTSDGNVLIWSAGAVTIYNAGSSLPIPNSGLTSRHAQTVGNGDFTITPTSQLHKEIVTVVGTADTFNGILGINGVQDGAELTIMWGLPATENIVVNIRSGVLGNPVLCEVDTGNVLTGRTKFYYNAQTAAWVGMAYNFPAP